MIKNVANIAICISGHMRTYKQAFQNQKDNIFNNLNCDIFLSTWQDSTTNWQEVMEWYQPTGLFIEKQIDFHDPYPIKHKNASNKHIISMYYKINQCINLAKNSGKTYDYIIRIRPDTVLNKKLTMDDLFKSNGKLFVTKTGDNVWIDDTFAYSTANVLYKYGETYNNLDSFYHRIHSLHPECMLKLNCDKYKIPVEISHIKAGVLRENYHVESHFIHGSYEDFMKL